MTTTSTSAFPGLYRRLGRNSPTGWFVILAVATGILGWCWAVASAIGAPVRVVTGSRSVRVDAGAVLVSREGDGSTFVAVVDGEASIEGREGAVAVPATSVVLVGVDGSVQVDEAGVEELLADPVLAANLAADDRR